VLWAGAIGVSGCRHHQTAALPPPPPPPPLLGGVEIRDVTPPGDSPAALDAPALERALRDRLLETGLFATSAPDGGPERPVVRVRADVAIESAEVGNQGAARARVLMYLRSRPAEAPGAIDEALNGGGEQRYAVGQVRDRPALFQRLVLRVSGDLIGGFAARRKLHVGSPDQVHAALTADAGDLREEAIRVAGERKLAQEVPALLALLNDPDESIRDAALGALIQIGDRRAVSELTRTRSLRDRREMRKIIEAIATLGGQEALDYLSFVAESHDDEEIRSEAAAAKARVERRMAEGK
jgi:hypothetical protein